MRPPTQLACPKHSYQSLLGIDRTKLPGGLASCDLWSHVVHVDPIVLIPAASPFVPNKKPPAKWRWLRLSALVVQTVELGFG